MYGIWQDLYIDKKKLQNIPHACELRQGSAALMIEAGGNSPMGQSAIWPRGLFHLEWSVVPCPSRR